LTVRFENRNYAFSNAFVDELARCGLRHVCIAPGSRSAPLTIAFARHSDIKTWVHLDERSAAFFAVGMAQALGEPVALVCTSGTAAANFYAAVVEARYGFVPLLVFTTDRPPELWDSGAPQTIDQVRMYGSHVKWSVLMPPPDATTALMSFVRSIACRAFAATITPPEGPVHVNFPFREPLEPVVLTSDFPKEEYETAVDAWQGRSGGAPFIRAPAVEQIVHHADIERLAAELVSAKRGVILCGPQPDSEFAAAVVALSRLLGYPILADPLSQVRCGSHDRSTIVDCYDIFLRDSSVVSALTPEVVLRFGAIPNSRPVIKYLERHRAARHVAIGDSYFWTNPNQTTTELFRVAPVNFCRAMCAVINNKAAISSWARRWYKLAEITKAAVQKTLEGFDEEMFEGKVFDELSYLLPDGASVFVGNSMPIRDQDAFFPSTARCTRFLANRGASGIDGVLSSALGAAAVSTGKLVLVLGDISFYHDMNGLLAAKAYGLDATIIVINNDGGGIFSFLPQAFYQDVFETYFGTPHGLTFRAAAELYGVSYRRVQGWDQFREIVGKSIAGDGATIIEVPSDRDLNLDLHNRVWKQAADAIKEEISSME
jgi:2-succinyl-5-enolpyruvyl-6-hydroxy-3-cyclohexene-1-carboxylate synthase